MRKASATEAGLHMEPNPLQKNMDFSAQDKETTAKEYAYECLPTNVSLQMSPELTSVLGPPTAPALIRSTLRGARNIRLARLRGLLRLLAS